MITETARVIAVEDGHAWVETRRKSVCGSCAVNKGCGTSVLAKVLGNRSSRIRVVNAIGAAVGEAVVVGVEDGMLVRTSFAIYIMPLLLMLFGALAGQMLATAFQWAQLEFATVVFGIAGLLSGFLWLRRYTRLIARDTRYQPALIGFADENDPEYKIAISDVARAQQRKV